MKQDRLEQFILDNRDEFDSFEPSPEVWDKIVLTDEKPKVRKLNLTKILWQAAAVAVILVSSYFFINQLGQDNKQNESRTAETKLNKPAGEIIVPELIEAEAYYTSLVNKKMNEVKKFSAMYPGIDEEVQYDLSELDSVCAELREDLKDDIANEEIINAMIQNYRLKLKVLEDILQYLQEDATDNETINERPKYEI